MKVLFVCSGNNESGISPVVKNQGNSLQKEKIDIKYFTIKGKGIKGYLKAVKKLKNHLKLNEYDIIHGHYSLSGIVASLAKSKPLVVSLMGSDVKAKKWFHFLLYIFYRFSWKACIVKTSDMKKSLGFKNIYIIPNGVNLLFFSPGSKTEAQNSLGWNKKTKHLLFAANYERFEKNYTLAHSAFQKLHLKNVELHSLQNIENNQMPLYYRASDVILLSSLWEGSPNVIKEAMACNRPITATNVGDIEWLFGNEPGHFIASFNSKIFTEKLKKALEFSEQFEFTNGQKRLVNLGLDAEMVATKIIELYKSLISPN